MLLPHGFPEYIKPHLYHPLLSLLNLFLLGNACSAYQENEAALCASVSSSFN